MGNINTMVDELDTNSVTIAAITQRAVNTRKVRKTTNLRHGRSKLNLLVNHLQQFFTEAVTSIAFIKEIENSLQTIKELWTIADF